MPHTSSRKNKNFKPRNEVIGFLVTHPNRSNKKHTDERRKARVPSLKQTLEMLEDNHDLKKMTQRD